MQNEAIKKFVEETVDREIKEQLGGGLFTLRKTTDTPPDSLSVVNRRYVNLNGTSLTRPNASIIGQQYFDTTINKPIFADGNNWRDATSSIVG